MNVLAVVAGIAPSIFGCVTDAAVTVCSTPWLTPQLGALVASALVIMNLVIKAGGSGTFSQNLAAPAVPVVPAIDAKPGVVTAGQVAAAGSNK